MAAGTLQVGLSVLTDQVMFAAHRFTARGSGTSCQVTRCCLGTSSPSADRTVCLKPASPSHRAGRPSCLSSAVAWLHDTAREAVSSLALQATTMRSRLCLRMCCCWRALPLWRRPCSQVGTQRLGQDSCLLAAGCLPLPPAHRTPRELLRGLCSSTCRRRVDPAVEEPARHPGR